VCFDFLYDIFFLKNFSFWEKFSEISDSIINVNRSSCKVQFMLVTFYQIWNFSTDFRKTLNMKFHENPSSGCRDVPRGRTDGWTDMTKLIGAFRNIANAPRKTRVWVLFLRRSDGRVLVTEPHIWTPVYSDTFNVLVTLVKRQRVVWLALLHRILEGLSSNLGAVIE
jgi:hypothetical protein